MFGKLLHCHYHEIYEEIGGLRLSCNVGATEEECDRLALVGQQAAGHIKALLHPVVGDVGITTLLHDMYSCPARGLELAGKGVKALLDSLIGIGVPPVRYGDFSVVGGNGESLPDAIIAAWIAAEVDAILPAIRVRGIDELVALRR